MVKTSAKETDLATRTTVDEDADKLATRTTVDEDADKNENSVIIY